MASRERKVDGEGRILIPADIRTLTGLTSGVRFVCRPHGTGVLVESASGTCSQCGAPIHEDPKDE